MSAPTPPPRRRLPPLPAQPPGRTAPRATPPPAGRTGQGPSSPARPAPPPPAPPTAPPPAPPTAPPAAAPPRSATARPSRPTAPPDPEPPPAPPEPIGAPAELGRRTWRETLDLGDRRGLTALGALLVLLLLGGAGGLYDGVTGTGLRTAFAVGFVAGCGLAAALVRRTSLRAVPVMPPLVFVALAVAQSVVGRLTGSGFTLDRQALDVVNTVVLGAPVLVGGTLLAAAVALVRWLLGRRR